jgi:energy-coupling factor transporter ATP-binding protein EcfA2
MSEHLEAILQELTPETWRDKRNPLFAAIVEEGLDHVEADRVLREAAKRVGAPLEALRRAWQDFLGPAPKEDNAAAVAVRLALERGEFWHAQDREPWASVPEGEGIVAHYPLRSPAFRAWLAGLYYRATEKPLYAQALQDARAVLEAKALYEGPQHAVHPRVAEHEGRVYLDLGREDWKAVEVGPEGWRVVESRACPVRFRRSRYTRPLPLPEPAGPEALEELAALLPLRGRRDWALVLGWLIGALNPRGPYPILVLTGEKGAGKSTVARALKSLLDPQEGGLRAEPRDVENVMVAAKNAWVLAYDNLSHVPPWLSDALCRLSTGGGLGKRELYTDGEEYVIEARRPVILTGISFGALRDDLADRTILITLSRLTDEERVPEEEFWQTFSRLHPRVLGALLEAASLALKRWSEVRASLRSLPRMADWALWVEAGAPTLGLEAGEAVRAFYEVQAALEQDLLEANPVARAILTLTQDWCEGQGEQYTTVQLLNALEEVMGLKEARLKPNEWPRTPEKLARTLPRLQAALRGAGILLKGERDRHRKATLWVLEKAAGQPPQPPHPPRDASHRRFVVAEVAPQTSAGTSATSAEPPQDGIAFRTSFAEVAEDAEVLPAPFSKAPRGNSHPSPQEARRVWFSLPPRPLPLEVLRRVGGEGLPVEQAWNLAGNRLSPQELARLLAALEEVERA